MRTTPTPDLERMVAGGKDRLRRRNMTRIGLAAAAVLLVGGGVYGVTQIGDGDADAGVATVPSEKPEAANPPNWPPTKGLVDAGTYRADVGVAADGTRIEADLTLGGSNWEGSNYPVVFDGDHFAGIGAYQAESVAAGCKVEAGLKPATEPQQLAGQLAQMPRSEVVQQPTPTTAFGYDAIHLRMRVDAKCGDAAAYYQVANQVAAAGGHTRGISYFEDREAVSGIVIIDFWVVDVNGTAVVVDMFHTEDAPKTLVDQATAARDSITFVTAE